MTAALQDGLFDLAPTVPAKEAGHRPGPRQSKAAIETPCDPTCIRCGSPEPPQRPDLCQLCPATPGRACATLCTHTNQPLTADICLVTTHVTGRIATSPHSGHTIAIVDCPHCGRRHWHAPTPGRHYRIGQCRKPYILHLPEGAATP